MPQQQIKRTLSGGFSPRLDNGGKRVWWFRLALLGGLLGFSLYLGVYLVALHSALTAPTPRQFHNKKSGPRHLTNNNKKQAPLVERHQLQKPAHVRTKPRHAAHLILTTTLGDIRIVLRPDYSPESVDYLQSVVSTQSCAQCRLYRAEKPGILQGIIKSPSVPLVSQKGRCPDETAAKVKNDCPAWDKQCACHGPVMERGFVAWAAGVTGPDFFIDDYKRPATWWGTLFSLFLFCFVLMDWF